MGTAMICNSGMDLPQQLELEKVAQAPPSASAFAFACCCFLMDFSKDLETLKGNKN